MRLPSADEIRKFSLLEEIHDATRSLGTSFVRASSALENLSPSDIEAWVSEMISEGLLHKDDDVILNVGLTYEGKQFLQNGFCKRQNLTALRHVARDRLLRWTYANDPHSEGVYPELSREYLWFYGRELTVSDLERAARDMSQHDLLSVEWVGDEHEVVVRITHEGRDCVELFDGDVDAYLESKGKGISEADETTTRETALSA